MRITDEEIIELLNDYIASKVENRLIFGAQVSQATADKIKRDMLEIVDRFIGHGEYKVNTEAFGEIRGISADLKAVWQELTKTIEAYFNENENRERIDHES